MAKQWVIRKKISGVVYDIYYYETSFYGGSKMITSRMEKVNEEDNRKDNSILYKQEGECFEDSKE